MHKIPHILMIDDDGDFLQILTYLIEAMGYSLFTAKSAEAGLELAKAASADLIFCDLRLHGEMSGFDFAREVQKCPDLCNTPVIAVTGFADKQISREAIDAGFTRVLTKPIKFVEIKRAVEQYVFPH